MQDRIPVLPLRNIPSGDTAITTLTLFICFTELARSEKNKEGIRQMFKGQSTNLALALMFMLGVIFTMQQRRGSVGRVQHHHGKGDSVFSEAPKRPSSQAVKFASEEEVLRERAVVEEEDRLKEAIPTLMRRPVKRPRQAMNNITSGMYWAHGSWGRVVATSGGCWAHPSVSSFAVQCNRKGLPQNVVIRVEHNAVLDVVRAECRSCDSNGGSQIAVRYLEEGKRGAPVKSSSSESSNSDSFDFEVKKGIPTLAVTVASFVVSSAACQTRGTFRNSCIVAVDVLFSVKKKQLRPSPPEVCFVTIGDWGAPLDEQLLVAKTLTQIVRRRMVKFIVSTGDNFYPTGVQTINDQQFLTTFEQPYNDPALQRLRWYICAGNHDQWGLPPQRDYGLEHPRWYFPAFHYNRSVPLYRDVVKDSLETIELVVLNTAGRDISSQCDMMDAFFASVEDRHGGYMRDLSRHWRFVVNHEPLFSGGIHGTAGRGRSLRQNFQPYMQQNLVHAYFNGDDHFLEIHRSNGTDYMTSGAGGGSLRYYTVDLMPDTAVFQLAKGDTHRGFMLHCIKEGVMQTTLVDGLTGEVLFLYKTKYFVVPAEFKME